MFDAVGVELTVTVTELPLRQTSPEYVGGSPCANDKLAVAIIANEIKTARSMVIPQSWSKAHAEHMCRPIT